MTGIWAQATSGSWQPMTPAGFVHEKDLHDLIESAPAMLPLAGAPRIAVVGREVRCGREFADLVGVEVDTGRPVVIEVKLAANADRRQALTQVLAYAAYLRRLDVAGFTSLLQTYLTTRQLESVAAAAEAAAGGDAAFTVDAFETRLADSLSAGRLRAVIVLDQAPADLVELVGYLQDVTSDRLALDLVVVTSYDVAGQRVLVPQLVEPDRSQVTATAAGTGKPAAMADILRGASAFEECIADSPAEHEPDLRRLLEWAEQLQRDHLAELYTSVGKGRWVLKPQVPRQRVSMICVWNDGGAYLSPFRSVFERLAPNALAHLDAAWPGAIGQGNYITHEHSEQLLDALRAAYVEAVGAAVGAAPEKT